MFLGYRGSVKNVPWGFRDMDDFKWLYSFCEPPPNIFFHSNSHDLKWNSPQVGWQVNFLKMIRISWYFLRLNSYIKCRVSSKLAVSWSAMSTHCLWQTALSMALLCNKDRFSRFRETNTVQWISVHTRAPYPGVCLIVWITDSYKDRQEHISSTWRSQSLISHCRGNLDNGLLMSTMK